MQKIRYILILLLFVLAGSLEDTSFHADAGGVQPSLSRSGMANSSAAVCNHFTAAVCACELPAEFSVELPAASPDHKAVARQRVDARIAASEAAEVRSVMRTRSRALHADAVDYYVFSLERILI